MKRVLAVLITAFGLIVWAQPASAAVFTEAGDAGETFAAAAVLPGGIDRIQGTLGTTDVLDQTDLYRFSWGGGDFYANTVNHVGPQEDLKLFLFDGTGRGIMMSDAGFVYPGPVASAYLQMAGADTLAAGTYYLGVANGWTNAYDTWNYSIFPEFVTGNTQDPADPLQEALAFWAFDSSGYTFTWPLAYEINLGQYANGAYGPTNPTPEPGTMMLLGGGLACLVGYGRRRMKK